MDFVLLFSNFGANFYIMIKRENYNKILQSIKKEEITILVGARQVGKTTLLSQLFSDLTGKGDNVLYLNMDIEDDAAQLDSQQNLINRIRLEFGEEAGFVCIDEIQQKEEAGRFLKGIYDMKTPYKLVVSGSGSLELKEKIGEALTGRKQLIILNPVNFREFCDYKTDYKYSQRLALYFSVEKEKSAVLLNEYLHFGGYPKVVINSDAKMKIETMNEVFTSYITKDISWLIGVRSPDKFVKMLKLLAAQSGGILNYSQLASDAGVSLSTLKNYLWYAEETFVITTVNPFFTNPKKELTKSPVIYFNDLGMLNYLLGNYTQVNKVSGFVFQNFVFNLLKSKYQNPTSPINHWRTKDKAEVDFVVHQNEERIPVEVKFSELKNTNISRSFRSYLSKYSPEKALIVNLELDDIVKIEKTTVHFIPYWKLLNLEL